MASGKLSTSKFFIGLFVLILIVAVLAFLSYYTWKRYTDKSIVIPTTNQNSLCLAVNCPTGDPTSVPLPPDGGETMNYCTVNAAPTSFVQALQICGGTNVAGACANSTVTANLPSVSSDQIISFADFYNNKYIDTCGFSWKDIPGPLGNTSGNLPQTLPESTTIKALAACAKARNITDANITALLTKCGTACN